MTSALDADFDGILNIVGNLLDQFEWLMAGTLAVDKNQVALEYLEYLDFPDFQMCLLNDIHGLTILTILMKKIYFIDYQVGL